MLGFFVRPLYYRMRDLFVNDADNSAKVESAKAVAPLIDEINHLRNEIRCLNCKVGRLEKSNSDTEFDARLIRSYDDCLRYHVEGTVNKVIEDRK